MNQKPVPEYIQKTIDRLADTAREQFDKQGSVAPVAYVVGEQLAVVELSLGSERERDETGLLIRHLVKLNDAHSVALMSEIWSLPLDMPNLRKLELMRKYGKPSACPERVEQLHIQLESRDGSKWSCFGEMHRDGSRVTLGRIDTMDMSAAETAGRFSGFFEPEKRMPSVDEIEQRFGSGAPNRKH